MLLELFEAKVPERFDGEMMAITQVFAAFQDGEDLQTRRYNLMNQPEAFSRNPLVMEMLQKGDDVLPILIADGEIATIGDYPELEDITELTGYTFQNMGCGCGGNCSCGK